MNRLNKLKGFLTDIWMLPLAIVLIVKHSEITTKLELMPTLNDVKVGNIIPTIVIFLLVMVFIRIYFFFQYSDVYEKSLMHNKRGKLWVKLSPWQQFISLRLERWILIISAVIIYLAMF